MSTTTSQTSRGTAAHVRIRPLAAADRSALAAAFARLSDDTRRRRFGAVVSHLRERDLDRLTRIDHHDHEALAAIVPSSGQIVGVARYNALRDDGRAAEVAITVDDEWQGRGIGRRLLTALTERARAEGIERLLAYVATGNRPVVDWLTRAGAVVEAHDGDAILFGIALDHLAHLRSAA